MATGLRKALRDAIYAEVIAAAAFSSTNTHKGRKYPGDSVSSLPSAVIYFKDENREIQTIAMGSRAEQYQQEFEIQIYAGKTGYGSTDEALDAYTDQIEAQFTDRTMGGLSFDSFFSNVTYELNAEGDSVYGVATMTLVVVSMQSIPN